MTTAQTLRPGDRVPDFALPGLDGKLRKFVWSFSGRPVALVAVDDVRNLDADQFARLRMACAAAKTNVVVLAAIPVATATPAWAKLNLDAEDPLLLCDGEQKIVPMLMAQGGAALGQAALLRSRVLVLDPNQRLAAAYDTRPLLAAAEGVAAVAQEVSSDIGGDQLVKIPMAPALVLPRVFEPDFCAQVIRLWHKGDHNDSGVSSRYGNVNVAELKRTEDYVVVEPMMQKAISDRLAWRIGPELIKVFAYDREFSFDAHVVLSYSAEGQHFFGAHRDNGAPTTADRSFAVSLNLNDDFDGGDLVFPEYSSIRVRPPAGGAAVFSCSLLHEVVPVTRGRRFALTTFFRTKA